MNNLTIRVPGWIRIRKLKSGRTIICGSDRDYTHQLWLTDLVPDALTDDLPLLLLLLVLVVPLTLGLHDGLLPKYHSILMLLFFTMLVW
mgnify:CR=1 FL=1